MSSQSNIVGRYAPSPTGRLHLGNLRTGLVAWLHTRLQSGRFLMRMEDVDTPRVVVGSDAQILNDLEWLGLDWDGDVLYQSARYDRYEEILGDLALQELSYPCFCSRKDIRLASSAPHESLGVYPGTCTNMGKRDAKHLMQNRQWAIRVRTSQALSTDCGDFVVRRADGLFAYQLAVVVDDLDQKVTHVIRGEDLASSTPRQRFLAALLTQECAGIEYRHVSLMLDDDGNRMSKRDGSFSAQEWRDTGLPVEKLIGKLAYSIGLLDQEQSISTEDLLRDLTIEKLNSVLNE